MIKRSPYTTSLVAPSRNRRSKAASRNGATTVEFAIVAPLIFVLFLGAVELTRINFIRQSANNACYEGARKAVVPGGTTAEARAEALRLLNLLGCGRNAIITSTSTANDVTVTVQIPINSNSWGATRFTSGMNVVQSITLSKESLK